MDIRTLKRLLNNAARDLGHGPRPDVPPPSAIKLVKELRKEFTEAQINTLAGSAVAATGIPAERMVEWLRT